MTSVPSTTTPTTTTSTTTSTCSSGSSGAPDGAGSGQTVDLDGDGLPDTLWVAVATSGATTVGVIGTSGVHAERTWDSASPVRRSVMAIDVNVETPPLLLADDGRAVDLWEFSDCAIVDVTNIQGDPYTFSLGFGPIGTGVGCEVVDGENELVGYDIADRSGDSVDWTATVVDVRGTEARNGTISSGTYTSPGDQDAIARLSGVTCGDKSIEVDGVSAR